MTTSSTVLRRWAPVALMLAVTACGTTTPIPDAIPVAAPPTSTATTTTVTAAPVTTSPAATGPVDLVTAQMDPCRLIRPDQYAALGVSPDMPPRTSTDNPTPVCSWVGRSTIAGIGVTTGAFDTVALKARTGAVPVDVGGPPALMYIKEKNGIVALTVGDGQAIIVTATDLAGDGTTSLDAAREIAKAVVENLAG